MQHSTGLLSNMTWSGRVKLMLPAGRFVSLAQVGLWDNCGLPVPAHNHGVCSCEQAGQLG